ncbi:hypothetical protein JXQ70_09475 [bacterium]|nr:hypothetical protein [bacterium]
MKKRHLFSRLDAALMGLSLVLCSGLILASQAGPMFLSASGEHGAFRSDTQVSEDQFPRIVFEQADLVYDLGNLDASEKKSARITFKNVGRAALQIVDVQPG